MRDQGIEAPTFATLVERFAIRGRTGKGELTDPPRAGGSVSADAVDTPRRRRRDVTIVAPTNMGAFAQVSGDHNPIHTSNGAALLAGLGTPDRARHVALGRRAARGGRGGPGGQDRVGEAHRVDRALPRHGPPGREHRPAGQPGRDRRRRRDRRGRLPRRRGPGDGRDRPHRRAEDRVRVPRPGHPGQGHGPRRPHPLQGRQGDLGPRRRAHPQGARLLHPRRGARQPDLPQGPRCRAPAPGRRAAPDPVHPGRDGGPRCRPGR